MKVRTKAQALKAMRDIFAGGYHANAEFVGRCCRRVTTTKEQRTKARQELRALREQFRADPASDPEVRLERKKSIDRLFMIVTSYRFELLRISRELITCAVVEGVGDTWQEAVDDVKQKREAWLSPKKKGKRSSRRAGKPK